MPRDIQPRGGAPIGRAALCLLLVALPAGCGYIGTQSSGAYSTDGGSSFLAMPEPQIERNRPAPAGMEPVLVAAGETTVTAPPGNLVFDPEQVALDAASRIETALLTFDHFQVVAPGSSRAELVVDVNVTKLVWDRETQIHRDLFGGTIDLSRSRSVDGSWIECEVDLTFTDRDGIKVAGAAAVGIERSDSGVQVLDLPNESISYRRVTELRAEPAGTQDIGNAVRHAIGGAIAESLPRIERAYAP